MEEAPNNRTDAAASPIEQALLIKYCILYLVSRERLLCRLLAAEHKYSTALSDKVNELIEQFDSRTEESEKKVLELQNDYREKLGEAKKLNEYVIRIKHNSQSSTPRDLAE